VTTTKDPRLGSWRRSTIRIMAVALAALAVALYVAVFFVQLPHIKEPDNPAPAYLFLAALYAVGAGLVWWDKRTLYLIGAAVQVILIGLFFWLLTELYGHGDQSFILDMVGLAAAVLVAQVVLLGLLAYLGATPLATRQGNDTARPLAGG